MNKLAPYRPFLPLPTWQRGLDRFFADFFPEFEKEFEAGVWTPTMDVTETDKAFVVKMDLPGVNKEDVKVSFQDGQLTVSGERKTEAKEEQQNFVRMERSYGSFFRAFTLPNTVKEDKIEAAFDQGVLTITIPKAEVKKPKQIKIA